MSSSSYLNYDPHTCFTASCVPCRKKQYLPAVPFAFVPPTNVGTHYTLPVPSYPILKQPFAGNQMFTPGPSYLNAIANDPTHPLVFMAYSNSQRN